MADPTNVPVLIDGDIFLYRCGFAAEKTKYLVDDNSLSFEYFDTHKEASRKALEVSGTVWSRKEVQPVENALQAIKTSLEAVYSKFWPKGGYWEGRIFLTGRGNFREAIEYDRGYKDNRDPAARPKHYKALKTYLIEKHKATVINGMEADDAIGIEAYARNIDKYVIVSNDKDLDQLSGWHYDWTKGGPCYFVGDEDALKMFYFQLLYGDPTDNVKGPVSEAKAKEIVEACGSPKECAEEAKRVYEKAYGDNWGTMIDTIGELVWMRRTTSPSDRGVYHPVWEHLHGTA